MKRDLHSKIVATLISIIGAFLLAGGCDTMLYEEMLDCPQGVYLKFYTKTPCDVDTLYPADIKNVNIYVFDSENKFVVEYKASNVTLSSEYEFLVPIYPHGTYSFVAWAGVNENYILQNLKQGLTTKEELLLSLKQTAGIADNLKGNSLYVGNSVDVSLPDPESVLGAYYAHIPVGMTRYTNNIEVIVEGIAVPQNYQVKISMSNGDYAMKGNILSTGEILQYPAEYTYGDRVLSAEFTTLKLENGYDDRIILIGNENKILYDEELLTTILLQTPDVNLNCDHDFVIRFKVQEETYAVTEVWVNDWLIHSYDTDVESDY